MIKEISFVDALKLVYDDWKEKGYSTTACMYIGHRAIAENFVLDIILFIDQADGEIIMQYPDSNIEPRLNVDDVFEVKWRYHHNLFEVKAGIVND